MKPQRNPVLIVAQKSMLLFVAQMAQHTITNVNWKLPIVRMSQRQSFGHLREHVNHKKVRMHLGNPTPSPPRLYAYCVLNQCSLRCQVQVSVEKMARI